MQEILEFARRWWENLCVTQEPHDITLGIALASILGILLLILWITNPLGMTIFVGTVVVALLIVWGFWRVMNAIEDKVRKVRADVLARKQHENRT